MLRSAEAFLAPFQTKNRYVIIIYKTRLLCLYKISLSKRRERAEEQ